MTGPVVEKVPAELRQVPHWVAWRTETRNGNPTKPPVSPHDPTRHASATDPSTWSTFGHAFRTAAAQSLDGVGFVFADGAGFAGVDLDDCRDPQTHAVTPWARRIVEALGSYAEVSPSGTGIKVFVRGKVPGPRCRRDVEDGHVEMYSSNRFFTVTGQHLAGTPTDVRDAQPALDALYAELFGADDSTTKAKPEPTVGADPDDAALLEKIRRSRIGAAFEALWRGDVTGYASASEADLALVSHLVWWTGGDADRADRLFRQSALCREKWDRADYRGATLERALRQGSYYDPRRHERSNGTGAADEPTTPTDPPVTPCPVADVVDVFQRRLYMPDPSALYALLGAVAANRMPGSPVWLMLVGPPAGGKTELLFSVARLPKVHLVGTLTEAALLSGVPNRDRASGAKGGLLREIGESGIIIAKDFTSTLALRHEQRASILAALREIFDGSWVRHVGSDGGRTLSWSGKVAFIAGCTPTIDGHHAVIATMGERFVFCRLPAGDDRAQGLRALSHVGQEAAMRRELVDVVGRLFAGIGDTVDAAPLPADECERMVSLAALAVRCRSAVERDPYRREIELVPTPEAPARLALTLTRLLGGMRRIGVPSADAWRVVTKCAFDSMPQTRRRVFELLLAAEDVVDTTTLGARTGYPTVTVRRACEDLTAHGVVTRQSGGKGKADKWTLSDFTRTQYAAAMVDGDGATDTFSEK